MLKGCIWQKMYKYYTTENCKAQLREIKEDLNKWDGICFSRIRRLNTKISVLPELIYRDNVNKSHSNLFCRNWQSDSKHHMEMQRIQISQQPWIRRIKLPGHWWLTSVIPATPKAEIRRKAIWSQSRQIVCETLSRKKGSRVAQVIESLPGKCEALNSNSSIAKRKKKE
jgi:hypothetical protein